MGEDIKLHKSSIFNCCTNHSCLQAECSLTGEKMGSKIQLFFFNSISAVFWKGGKEEREMSEIFQYMLLESSYI